MPSRIRQLVSILLAGAVLAAIVPVPALGAAAPRRVQPMRMTAKMHTGASQDRVLVGFRDRSAKAVARTLSRNSLPGTSAVMPKRGPAVVRVPKGKTRDQVIVELNRDDNVAYAEPVYYRTPLAYTPPNDPAFLDATSWDHVPYGKSWWLRQNGLNAAAAWQHGFSDPAARDFPVRAGGADFKVGVIDTGFFMTHPDKGPNIVAGHDFFQSETGGVYVEDDDVTPADSGDPGVDAHGTCTAGQVAAATNNGVGVASVGYDAQVRVYKVAGVDLDGDFGLPAGSVTIPNDRMIAAIYRAADDGCRIISISLGGEDPSTAEQNAIDYAWSKGCVVVAAMGNGGSDWLGDPVALYPAGYTNVVGVGSYGMGTGTRARSSFSNYGPRLDILAPGELVWNLTKPNYGNAGYDWWDGTSMATPAAAGAIAHMWRYVPSLTNQQIVDLVQQSALDAGPAGRDNSYGWGFMDMSRAMTKIMTDYPYLTAPALSVGPTPQPDSYPVSWNAVAGNSVVYDVRVNGTRVATTTATSISVPFAAGENTLTVQATSAYNYYDEASTASMRVIVGAIAGATPTDSWGGAEPQGWTRDRTPRVSVPVRDATSGLLPDTAEYRYSTEIAGWSTWQAASLDGPRNSDATQTISAIVPFNADSRDKNLVQFRVTNGSSLIGTSPVYTIKVDGTAPAGAMDIAHGDTTVTTHTVAVSSDVIDLSDMTMRVSRDGGANWTQPTTYSAETTVTLRRGRGPRTVLAEYTDEAGNSFTATDTVTVEAPVSVERVSGPGRYDTAIEISQQHFDSADTVIVATGQNFADALAASALAGSYRAPLLLTPTASLFASIPAEVQRLGATKVIVVGGEPAVSKAVYDALAALPGVTARRISGIDRYATAAAIALEVQAHEQELGNPMPAEIFLARGDGYADALAVSPFAYSKRIPILLTRTDAIPASTWQAIWALAPSPAGRKIVIPGSTAAVSTAVTNDLRLNGRTWERIDGAGRYDTARAVAEYGVAHQWATWNFVGVATGENFPDALGGGIAAGARGGVILLTKTAAPVPQLTETLAANKARTGAVEAFGGPPAVSETVVTTVDAIYR